MNTRAILVTLMLTPVLHGQGQRLSESTGVTLFLNNCTRCHGTTPVDRAPDQSAIKQMPPERIYEAITTGAMKTMAEN